jgi:beta-ureidopropionase / N-carbamoyl-L-amino-acid hydrolase
MEKMIRVNLARLLQRLDELAHIGALENGGDASPFGGDASPFGGDASSFGGDASSFGGDASSFGGVSRLALTDADKQARDLTAGWMDALGLAVHIDQVGNIIGVRPGEADLPPVMLGSHIDTVTVAGCYDGSYGVMAALEVINALNDHQIKTRRPLAVAAFTNEEGVRYTPGMLGSAVYAGFLPVSKALEIRGFDGSLFGAELERIGYAGSLACGAIRPYAYLELHIEQGPVLDSEKIPVGAVQAVTGITWLEVTVRGAANHAGTTPIALRRDAGLAAARLVQALREIALSIGGEQRATCGMLSLAPNAINVIPGEATLSIDLRNPDGAALVRAEEMVYEWAREIEASDGVTIAIRALEHILPVEFDQALVGAIERAARELGYPSRRMVSGAGHDAQLMARMCPAAMIFIPSRAGISHSPAEYSSPQDLETGANVLLQAALQLTGQKE